MADAHLLTPVRMGYNVICTTAHICVLLLGIFAHCRHALFRTSTSEICGAVDMLPVCRLIEEQAAWQRLVDHHQQQADAAEQ